MNHRPLKDSSLDDIVSATYGEGPLRQAYDREPAHFIHELAERLRELTPKQATNGSGDSAHGS